MTGTPRCPALLLLVLVMVAGSGHAFSCNPRQHTAMQERFTGCRGGLLAEYHASSSSSDICQLVAGIVEGCGRVWEECHTPGDIATMRNMHIQAFIEQWEGRQPGIEECGVVREYRSEATSNSAEAVPVCSDTETTEAMAQFQNCSHTIVASLYRRVGDTSHSSTSTTTTTVQSLVCAALADVKSSCPRHLARCYAPGDLAQMLASHQAELNQFLLRILQDRMEAIECKEEEVVVVEDEKMEEEKVEEVVEDNKQPPAAGRNRAGGMVNRGWGSETNTEAKYGRGGGGGGAEDSQRPRSVVQEEAEVQDEVEEEMTDYNEDDRLDLAGRESARLTVGQLSGRGCSTVTSSCCYSHILTFILFLLTILQYN